MCEATESTEVVMGEGQERDSAAFSEEMMAWLVAVVGFRLMNLPEQLCGVPVRMCADVGYGGQVTGW